MTQLGKRLVSVAAWTTFAALSGCTGDLANLTASFGGNLAGQRGEIQVLFINNTDYRAVFTFGTYDQTDPTSVPSFRQFTHDQNALVLDGDSARDIGTMPCARVFSIGGSRMLSLIDANVDASIVVEEALVDGVEFFEIPDGEDTNPISQGFAPPFEALLGVDFSCQARLIIRFETNDAGPDPFRVDFELIASETTR